MKFRDRWEINEDGDKFIFTVGMQRRLSQAGLPVEPKYLKQHEPTRNERTAEAAPRPRREHPPQATESRKEPDSFQAPLTIQIDPMTGKYIGCMKWYNAKKGYGFIIRGAGEEIFFHKSNVIGDPMELNEGQGVLYDLEETNKGPEAAEIEPYDGDIDSLLA